MAGKETNMKRTNIILAATLAAFSAGETWGAAPSIATYQGRLKESNIPVTGNRFVRIYLCPSESGGGCIDTGSQGVGVTNGLFRSTFTVPASVDLTSGQWWVEVVVGSIDPPATTLSPRERLTATPFAMYASSATTLVGNPYGAGVTISTEVFINSRNFKITGSNPAIRINESGGSNPTLTFSRSDSEKWLLTENYGAPADNIAFYDSSVNAKVFQINQGGNVGIGTTAPTATLHVSTSVGSASVFVFQASSGGGQDRLVVRADGTVGVGTTSPISRMEIQGSAGVIPLIVSTGPNINDRVMQITSTGRVGIGTTNPQAPLSISGSAGSDSTSMANLGGRQWRMQQNAGDATDAGSIDYRIFDANSMSVVGAGTVVGSRNVRIYDTLTLGVSAPAAGTLFQVGTATLTVTSVGSVGIGTTSPARKLDVDGGMILRSSMTLAGVSAPPLSSAGQGAIYFDSTSNKFQVSENGGTYLGLSRTPEVVPAGCMHPCTATANCSSGRVVTFAVGDDSSSTCPSILYMGGATRFIKFDCVGVNSCSVSSVSGGACVRIVCQ